MLCKLETGEWLPPDLGASSNTTTGKVQPIGKVSSSPKSSCDYEEQKSVIDDITQKVGGTIDNQYEADYAVKQMILRCPP